MPNNPVDRVIGAPLRRELLKRGFVVVPMAPSKEMVGMAAKAQTGSFSSWNFLALWLSALALADPEAKPYLDDVAATNGISPVARDR